MQLTPVARALIAAALVLGGCVKGAGAGSPAPTECSATDPCPGDESCMQGLCFGNPPDVPLAAQLYEPSTRSGDLAPTEIQTVSIGSNGMVQLAFANSVEFSGRVVISSRDATSIAATVIFQRPSRIAGLPDYIVSVTAAAGAAEGEVGFSARLSPNVAGEQYSITVIPDDGTFSPLTVGQLPPNALAPPLHSTLAPLTMSSYMDIPLSDSQGLRPISAHVLDAANRGMAGMVVTAFGRRNSGAELELASSTGTTDANGLFTIYVPLSWQNQFNIIVKPGSGTPAPSLERDNVNVPTTPTTSTNIADINYPTFPTPTAYQLPVLGPNPAGGTAAAIGALVTLTTVVSSTTDSVIYTEQSSVNTSGMATVTLLPGGIDGNRTYTVDVTPLPNTPPTAISGTTLVVGPPDPMNGAGGVLDGVDLPSRAYVTGRVVDATGLPVMNMTVQPQLSAAFLAGLSTDDAATAGTIALPVSTTDSKGNFTIYLDATLVGNPAIYDFDLIPPVASLLPRSSRQGVALASSANMDLGNLQLPDGSLALATVVDETGMPVANAQMRVYLRGVSSTQCPVDDTNCTMASQLTALGNSDSLGQIILTLPSSP